MAMGSASALDGSKTTEAPSNEMTCPHPPKHQVDVTILQVRVVVMRHGESVAKFRLYLVSPSM